MSAQPKQYSNASTFVFMLVLCVVCALLLSMVAAALRPQQQAAKALDRNKQLLIAAKILSYDGYFLLKDKDGSYTPAKETGDGFLVQGEATDIASEAAISRVYNKRIFSYLTNAQGEVKTFKELGINEDKYLEKNAKMGYYLPEWRLLYAITPNSKESFTFSKPGVGAYGYVIPINGFGLWSAIYGFIALESNADTVIGITWYQQEETAGLGAEIANPKWQKQFANKLVFMEGSNGETNFNSAPLGIIVVKGQMSAQYAKTNKAKSSVDGISGATLTGNGVMAAYATCLHAYRDFLVNMHNANKK